PVGDPTRLHRAFDEAGGLDAGGPAGQGDCRITTGELGGCGPERPGAATVPAARWAGSATGAAIAGTARQPNRPVVSSGDGHSCPSQTLGRAGMPVPTPSYHSFKRIFRYSTRI